MEVNVGDEMVGVEGSGSVQSNDGGVVSPPRASGVYGGEGRVGVEGRGENSGEWSLGRHFTIGVKGGLGSEGEGRGESNSCEPPSRNSLLGLMRGVKGGESKVGVEGRSFSSMTQFVGVECV